MMMIMVLGSAVEESFVAAGIIYLLLFIISSVQLVRHSVGIKLKRWTLHKGIHTLLVLITSLRATFLLLIGISHWCDVAKGSISQECPSGQRILFYILDQAPSLFFLSLCTLLIWFWAQVYYTAINRVITLRTTIKPYMIYMNITVYVLQAFIWIMYSTAWLSERHYVTRSYALLTTLAYLILSIAGVVLARRAYVEMQSIPVELQIRFKKLNELAIVTTCWTSCFMCRSLILLSLSLQDIQLHDKLSWVVISLYFGLLEVIPCVVVLFYYRVVPLAAIRTRFSTRKRINTTTADNDDNQLLTTLLEE